MNEEVNKPVNKSYHWDPTAEVRITGLQYAIIRKFASLFGPLVQTNAEIWDQMIDQGLVKDEEENIVMRDKIGDEDKRAE